MKRKIMKISAVVVLVVALGAWLGLRPVLRAMGLHPHFQGQRYMLVQGKALIICTSHDRLGEDGAATGVFGSELTAPYYEFKDGRMQVDVASIKGGEIPIDPMSFKWIIKTNYDDRYLSDERLKGKVRQSLFIGDVDFTSYNIIYLAGGWGAAYDLGFSETLGRKITEAYASGKVLGGVCHGPLGLLKAFDENGDPLVKGRRLTAVTNNQLKQLRILQTPQHPERELRAAGALFESQTAFLDIFANHVVVDGHIVTGQNQNAGAEIANVMMMVAGGTKR